MRLRVGGGPDDGIILDWAFAGLMASLRPQLPFAIALVLLNGVAGPDRKKIGLLKIAKSNKKKPFSMNARIDEPYLGLINCSHNPCFLNQGIVSHA
jgi:hypothetical protein